MCIEESTVVLEHFVGHFIECNFIECNFIKFFLLNNGHFIQIDNFQCNRVIVWMVQCIMMDVGDFDVGMCLGVFNSRV